jgi:patatin-like phospholipase/acyl hydrolase
MFIFHRCTEESKIETVMVVQTDVGENKTKDFFSSFSKKTTKKHINYSIFSFEQNNLTLCICRKIRY